MTAAVVRMTYTGLGDHAAAVAAFEDLRPLYARLQAMQRRCKPFGHDYHALAVSLQALETTAYHFTREPYFFGLSGDAATAPRRSE